MKRKNQNKTNFTNKNDYRTILHEQSRFLEEKNQNYKFHEMKNENAISLMKKLKRKNFLENINQDTLSF